MPRYETIRSGRDSATLLAEGLRMVGARNVKVKGRTVYYNANDDDHADRLLTAGYNAAIAKSIPSVYFS